MSCSAASKRQSEYVMLRDGTYWVWTHEIDSDLTLGVSDIIAITVGAIIGLLAGARIAILLWGPHKAAS
jgi:hypothetical protein